MMRPSDTARRIAGGHHIDAPFQPLLKPLTHARVTISSTAARIDPANGDQGRGAAYNGGAFKRKDGSAKSRRDFSAPTNRSHRVMMATDAPDILARCRADDVDAALLVPNCPVCHQTLALVARPLEANGISTMLAGCAKDIVEYAAVPPRALIASR